MYTYALAKEVATGKVFLYVSIFAGTRQQTQQTPSNEQRFHRELGFEKEIQLYKNEFCGLGKVLINA